MCESNHSAKEDDMRQARLKPDYQDTWGSCKTHSGVFAREKSEYRSQNNRTRCP
jgi:hypothetical protein